MPRLLELFSGTGSVGAVFAAAGWDVVSLDSDPASAADIKADVLTWDHEAFPRGHFDAIWASPPCTEYSIARSKAKRPRDLALADSLAQRTLDLVSYFQPRVWWIENPHSGLLRKRPVVADLSPPRVVDYCRYGALYRKRTALWTNAPFEGKLCDKACPGFAHGRHSWVAQRGGAPRLNMPPQPLCVLHALPSDLVRSIEEATRAFISAESVSAP